MGGYNYPGLPDPWAGESLKELYRRSGNFSPSMIPFSETPVWEMGILWIPFQDPFSGDWIMVDADSPQGRAARSQQMYGQGQQTPGNMNTGYTDTSRPGQVETIPNVPEETLAAVSQIVADLLNQAGAQQAVPPPPVGDITTTVSDTGSVITDTTGGTGDSETSGGLSTAEKLALLGIPAATIAALGLGGPIVDAGYQIKEDVLRPSETKPAGGVMSGIPPATGPVAGAVPPNIEIPPNMTGIIETPSVPPYQWQPVVEPGEWPTGPPGTDAERIPPGGGGWPKIPGLPGGEAGGGLGGLGGGGGPMSAPIFGGVGGKSPVQSLFPTTPYKPGMAPTLGQLLRAIGLGG